jgi:hypothetical protein
MNKEMIVTSAFCVHRSKFSCPLAAALLDGLFEQPARSDKPALAAATARIDFVIESGGN